MLCKSLKFYLTDKNTWWIEILMLKGNALNHLTVCKQMIDIKKKY